MMISISINMLWTLPLMAATIVPKLMNLTFFRSFITDDIIHNDQYTVISEHALRKRNQVFIRSLVNPLAFMI